MPNPLPSPSARQMELANLPGWVTDGDTVFLSGAAGSGKTTLALARLHHLLVNRRVPGRRILVLTPQRSLGAPYRTVLRHPDLTAGSQVTVQTVGGLARTMVHLYWPLLAGPAGFAHPDQEPVFLTLETAQYYMASLVRPLVASGRFDGVRLSDARLISQVLDNLNKAAIVGFPHTDVARRLKEAWQRDSIRPLVYDAAQELVDAFRELCLKHNLLDFSLQIEVFSQTLLDNDWCRTQLFRTYEHLIVDNVEEDTPVAHDLLVRWLPHVRSALVIYDEDAGYRLFLGADPDSARRLAPLCAHQVQLSADTLAADDAPWLPSPAIRSLQGAVAHVLTGVPPAGPLAASPRAALEDYQASFYPQMLDWAANRIADLVFEDQVPPGEIVVLAPYVSDSLRFSLMDRLARRGVIAHSHRPSRELQAEPATRSLLTLAALAHPGWQRPPLASDVAQALYLAVDGLDPVRAHLLTRIVYRTRAHEPPLLTSFDIISAKTQDRITYRLGQAYEQLRRWLAAYQEETPQPLDVFLSRLFGEVVSQPGFGFHRDYDAGRVAAQLIESARKFRWAVRAADSASFLDIGRDYLDLVQSGLLGALYVESWHREPADAVLIAPAYTFLMRNRIVAHQFWLDGGATAWAERLDQPLTHPYILSRSWQPGQLWTDVDELVARQENLQRLLTGLLRHCRTQVHVGISQWGEQGYEQQGPLLQVLQRVFSRYAQEVAHG